MGYIPRHVRRYEKPFSSLIPFFIFFPVSLFWMECVVKVYCFGTLISRGLLFALLFSFSFGFLGTLFSSLWGERGNRMVSILLAAASTLWYIAQTVYYAIFRTFLSLSSVEMAGAVLQFWRTVLTGIRDAFFPLLLLVLPLILLCVFGRRYTPDTRLRLPVLLSLFGGAVVLHVVAVALIMNSTAGIMSPRVLYRESFVPDLSVSTFGVATTLQLDAKQLLFGTEENLSTPDPSPEESPEASPSPAEIVYEPNVLDIDFDALIAETSDKTLLSMHNYFSQREPTLKNEYTGIFKGKNLIFLTAEGFSSYAVNKELTPTLYKLANTGFVFTDFYNPLWWVSTCDGEYVACTGLIPKGGVRSFKLSGYNSMPFCMGNQFRALGYPTYAYHDHTYTYYNRDISHPNMGYIYKGVGNGLEVKKTWPESDLEMMQVTIPEYIDAPPFHAYYMTVSGHMNYSFLGNSMAYKHKDEVADLDMSETARAYIACNIELNDALEYLLDELEKAGQLENTVICLSADHYPYGMEKEALDELAGHEVEENFEVYKSTLILWSGDMEEPIIIDKPCESLDIIATLSNLFGLPYDSRLIMGQDILSDTPGLVIFSNRSFITELGRYDSTTDTFTPNPGAVVPDGYVLSVIKEVRNLFDYSVKILDNDYYAKVGLTVSQ